MKNSNTILNNWTDLDRELNSLLELSMLAEGSDRDWINDRIDAIWQEQNEIARFEDAAESIDID